MKTNCKLTCRLYPRSTSTAYLTVEFQPYGGVKGGGGRTPLGETDIPALGRLEDDSRIESQIGLIILHNLAEPYGLRFTVYGLR